PPCGRSPRYGSCPALGSTMHRSFCAPLGLLIFASGVFAGRASADTASLIDQVDAFRAAHEAAIVGELDELSRLRSIAADPAGLAATADRLRALLVERGFEATELASPAGGPPLVYGALKVRGVRHTVIFYAHY